ncbi:MAG: dihydrodipicolinate synthase family protein [Deltaproteobacteria bacterium]|nr:dihydrodipicolinate synthase family protein [Deltaproteobacteria bacterium]
MEKILSKNDLKGIMPAIVTPTDAKGKFKQGETKNLLNHLIRAGVSGIVPMGGTGEFTNMPPKERVKFVEFVAKEVGGKLPVIPGILSPGFHESVEIGIDFKKAGADALMLLTPFYVKPTQEGIIKYFLSFMDKVKIPVVLYDIPYRTMTFTDPTTVRKIAEKNELLIGMKACNPDLAHFVRLMMQAGDLISILSGEEYLFIAHVLLGAKGGILATCNLFPNEWIKMYNFLQKRDTDSAKRILFSLVPMIDAAFSEINPGPLKAAMTLAGFNVGPVLSPLVAPQSSTVERLLASMKALKKASK